MDSLIGGMTRTQQVGLAVELGHFDRTELGEVGAHEVVEVLVCNELLLLSDFERCLENAFALGLFQPVDLK